MPLQRRHPYRKDFSKVMHKRTAKTRWHDNLAHMTQTVEERFTVDPPRVNCNSPHLVGYAVRYNAFSSA